MTYTNFNQVADLCATGIVSGPFCMYFKFYGVYSGAVIVQTPYLKITRLLDAPRFAEPKPKFESKGLNDIYFPGTPAQVKPAPLASFPSYGAIFYFVRTVCPSGDFCSYCFTSHERRVHVKVNEYGTGQIIHLD